LRGHVVGDEVAAVFGEGAVFNRGAGLFHRSDEHASVVYAEHTEAENFADVEEMAQVGASEIAAGEAVAVFFDGAEVRFVSAGFNADAAFAGEGGAVSGDAGGQDAIEHVDAASDEFDHLGGRAEAHGVARLVGGKMRFGDFDGAKHFGFRFADANPADGVTVEFEGDERFGAFFAEMWVDAALDDAEDHLAGGARLFAAFGGPTHSAFDGGAKFTRGAGVRRAIVEDHRYIGAEFALNLHRFFRAQEQERAIEMRTEFDAVSFDFADSGEAEDLEAAAVGQDRELPIDEVVKATCGADDVHPGTDMEMIGVAEDDLSTQFAEFAWVDGFDAALGADRHEDGSVDNAVGSRKAATASFGRRVGVEELKHRSRCRLKVEGCKLGKARS
jgi:hypothetical protein